MDGAMEEAREVATVTASGPLAATHPYFPVGSRKFVTLLVTSFGLYAIYWCYQNWVRIKASSGDDISPFWRAFFSPLFGFDLFRRIEGDARTRGIDVTWRSTTLGLLLLLTIFMSGLPDRFVLLGLAPWLALVPVARTVERINRTVATAEDPNEEFSGLNVAGIVVGGLLLVLVAIGSLLPA